MYPASGLGQSPDIFRLLHQQAANAGSNMSAVFLQYVQALQLSWHAMRFPEEHEEQALADLFLSSTFPRRKDRLGVRAFLELCRDRGATNQTQHLRPRIWPAFPDLCSAEGPQEKPFRPVPRRDPSRYTEPP